ncbi:hypothetical protein LCGC14_1402130 [marine sediment metagenome]|uniref:Uncharacterized protein n=1 Tax=marine sediment metagenome TaxID=412755 RepID=A0A0F9MCD7_9ZZZZ
MTTIPIKKDTAPAAIRKLIRDWLYDSREWNEYLDKRLGLGTVAPTEWMDAAALEAYTAFTETLDTWVETLIAGRPYDTPLVEWEHRELVDIDDAKEIAANQGHRYG